MTQDDPIRSVPDTGDGAEPEDAALLRAYAGGDLSAARALTARLAPRALVQAGRMLGDRAEAEDVAQEAFLRLWRTAPGWRGEARVGTWLHRVAYNICIDRLRRRDRGHAELPDDLVDPAPGPAQDRQRAQVAAAVRRALARLPERQRAAIALVHYQELGNVEAAGILGVSVEALESLLARGRRALRERLGPRRGELTGRL